MECTENPYDVGVIIARFQVHRLTEAHLQLIAHVVDRHHKVVLLLGVAPVRATRRNPLDFEARRQMVAATFPGLSILPINDVGDDAAWSENVDALLTDVVLTQGQTALLYGSRDSFIPHYQGRFPVRELPQAGTTSGTEARQQIHAASPAASEEFRAGAVWATGAQHPHVYATVDIAIVDDTGRLLLGHKRREQGWRFIGGFADPALDSSYEDAARRETREETGLELSDVRYLGSCLVDDWRYRGEADAIITLLFLGRVSDPTAIAADDIAEVRWFTPEELRDTDIVTTHRPLLRRFTATTTSAQDRLEEATHA